MKINELGSMVDNLLTEEVKKYIIENMRDMEHKQVYHIKCDGEPIDTLDTPEEAHEVLDKLKKEPKLKGKRLIIEPGEYQSYEHMIDELDKMGDTDNMKNKLKESKRSILVTEAQMRAIVKNLVNEDVPGVEVTKKAQARSKKDAADNLKDVETKINKATDFEGNDNPEFPKAIGKGNKTAVYPSSEEVTEIEDNMGRGPQDLDYDNEPGEEFRKREKMYLQGDQKTGNSQDAANVVKSDLGEKLAKTAERKIKAHKERPLYAKEAQPVETGKDNINEEVKRMKEMFSYNKKTQ